MRAVKKWGWLAAPVIVIALAAMPAHAGKGGGGTDRIWLAGYSGAASTSSASMKYGDTFSAGWQSSRTAYPWGLAQCWVVDGAGNKTGAPFWSEYRALQADGTIGVFEFASADPDAVWPSAGGTCNLSLIVRQGNRQTVSAVSSDFTVGP